MQKKSCQYHYHIRQVAAFVVKLVLGVHLGPPFGGREGHRGSAMILFETALLNSIKYKRITT